jgi:probable addiction module antidote protein
MPLPLTKFDAAEVLKSEAHVRAYLEAALEENDPIFFQQALGTVARARGMQAVADKSETTRAGLYKALHAAGNPEFSTVLRVVNALGYRLTVVPVPSKRAKGRKHG